MSEVFFITGCVRSATTAFAKILDTCTNAEVSIEQVPKLLIESREMTKGNLAKPEAVLLSAKQPYIQDVLDRGLKYGDKNPAYIPFIAHFPLAWDCKIIFLVRDGRDVVRSMMDFHELYSGNIFAMAEDGEPEGSAVPEEDPWDYSRLRPSSEDPVCSSWTSFDRFQKCAWHWAKVNELALDNLAKVDADRRMTVDVSNTDTETVERVFDFLGLSGFDPVKVGDMLDARINSLLDKAGKSDRFPKWKAWTDERSRMFEKQAGEMMSRLGYWP